MAANYKMATLCLQENLKNLDGDRTPEQTALWNISKALIIVCDALSELEGRVPIATYP